MSRVVTNDRAGFKVVAAGHYRRGDFEVLRANKAWHVHENSDLILSMPSLHDAQAAVRKIEADRGRPETSAERRR